MTKEDLEQISKVIEISVDKSINCALEPLKKDIELLKKDMESFKKEIREEMKLFEKRMLDKMFLFEQEYGDKIMIIYDIVSIMQDKINECLENQRKITKRMDYIDVQNFSHEKRISNLENLIKTN